MVIRSISPKLVYQAYELGKSRGSLPVAYATNESGGGIFVPNPPHPGDHSGIILYLNGDSSYGYRPDDFFPVNIKELLAIAEGIS